MLDEIQEIKCQKVSFESALRGLVEGHLRLLDIDREAAMEEAGKIERIATDSESGAAKTLPGSNQEDRQVP